MAYVWQNSAFVSPLNSFFVNCIEYSFHIKHTNIWFFIREEKMKFLRDTLAFLEWCLETHSSQSQFQKGE